MIYVTGDLHGDIDRFRSKPFRKLRKHDILLVCGDFGFLWDGSKKEQKLLKWIGKQRYEVLFVEGTHDNLDLLAQYPQTQWNGGMVRVISGKLKYLCRGEIYQIGGSSIFAFGGGESTDADVRQDFWWSQELPSQQEIAAARARLEKSGNQVDYIITHQCSRKLKKLITMEDNEVNVLDTFFDQIREDCTYKRWFFGGYHMNKVIPPKEIAVYDAVTPITSSEIE